MPRATRKRAQAPEPVVEEHEDAADDQEEPGAEQEEEQDEDAMELEEDAHPLEFDEDLTWRAGRPISVTQLLIRLKKFYQELSRMEQIPEQHTSRALIMPKAQELANTQLMGHRDAGVKAWTMACIAQMIRVTAPDALYKQSQLKEFFIALATVVIPALADPSDAYHKQYMDVLNSVSSFRSIVLITDIPGSDNVIITLFANSFDLLSGNMKGSTGEPLPKSLEYHLTNIMSIIQDERGNLPTGAVDVLLAQFLRADPETWAKSGKEPPRTLNDISAAYNVARAVCIAGADLLRGAIGKYFGSVLIDASAATSFSAKSSKTRGRKRTHAESENESDDGMLTPLGEEDVEEAEKAHRLLRELWRSAPDVIEDAVPQMEPEIKAENVELRTLAVQTIGDMVAGVGAAGPPPPQPLDPAAYPSQSIENFAANLPPNALYTPMAHHDFAMKYPDCYNEFIARRNDKSTQVRSAWTTAAARIISTSGGGRGLDPEQETMLLRHLKTMLMDTDEKVRLAAVHAIAGFDFDAVIHKLGTSGGVDDKESLLCTLTDRIRDPKPHVRSAAIELLAKLWGVASGAIAEGSERIQTLLGGIPSKILGAVFVQNPHINALVYRVLYESLLPLSYPPIKARNYEVADSQRVNHGQSGSAASPDPDDIRAERILVFVRGLDKRIRSVFWSLQQNQKVRSMWMDKFLTASESLKDKSSEAAQKKSKQEIAKCFEVLANSLHDPALASEHLRIVSQHYDKRVWHLMRYCYNPEHEYSKVIRAIKEVTKIIRQGTKDGPSPLLPALETITSLLRNVALLVYNRSHVRAVTGFSRTDDKELGEPANEVLKQISSQNPQAFKAYAKEYCQALKRQAPTSPSAPDRTAVDTLKACADFALRSPNDMPKDREFYQAMIAFAQYGMPPKAAKHAVTIVAASADKKEMYIREIIKQSTESFDFGVEGFLSKLAALSQVSLLRSEDIDPEATEALTNIALGKILSQNRTPATNDNPQWESEIDEDLSSKLWALKLLVNGIRGRTRLAATEDAKVALRKSAYPVYRLLNTAIENEGELSNTSDGKTARHHRPHIRLAAAVQLLKMSCTRSLDSLFQHADFNRLAKIAQDPLPEVRSGFAKILKKYLGQGRLPPRFYGLIFMYAFEPAKPEKEQTTNWLRARATQAQKADDAVIVLTFCRFLSLLAHHQDFSSDPEELEDFVEYILFFLCTVATQSTLPLIYSQAQRIKTVQDGIDSSKSDNLYILSDLAQAVIVRFQEEKGWTLEISAGNLRLPGGVFAALNDPAVKRDISEKQFLPEELVDSIEELVKQSLKPKSKKRKAEGNGKQTAKKVKSTSAMHASKKPPARKAPKKRAKTPKKRVEDVVPTSDRRKSTRTSNAKSYVEYSDIEDDDELERWNGEANGHDDDAGEDDDVEADSGDNDPGNESGDQEEASRPVAPAPPAHKPAKKGKSKTPQQPSRKAPTMGRATRERDVMEIPSESDELSDAPSDLEA